MHLIGCQKVNFTFQKILNYFSKLKDEKRWELFLVEKKVRTNSGIFH
jgi:hypothetical protein